MEEIWKPIPEWENQYEASSLGRIKNIRSDFILKQSTDSDGYKQASLIKDKKIFSRKVHRLIIYAFVGKSYLLVDHINGIKHDNRIENLRYCTARENNIFLSQSLTNRSSKYTGVTKRIGRRGQITWRAKIRIGEKDVSLGEFIIEKDAAKAYQDKLKELQESGYTANEKIKFRIA